MSAGNFIDSKYESNSGRVYAIRVQPETLALTLDGTANAAPTGDIDQEVSAKAKGGKREIGCIARTVTVRFTGTVPDGYSGDDVTVPVLTPGLYNAAVKGVTGTYLGEAVAYVGKSAERLR